MYINTATTNHTTRQIEPQFWDVVAGFEMSPCGLTAHRKSQRELT